METLRKENSFKRLRNRYRLVILNDDTFEEVVKFKLNRVSVYVALSSIFVLLVGVTLAFISFTNLRFLIPGYGKQGNLQELRMLKIKADSLEKTVALQHNYLTSIQNVLRGDTSFLRKDTTLLPADTTLQFETD